MHAPVYLVRHGQSDWNVRRLTQGQTVHPALTELGREQAAAAAVALADELSAVPSARLLTSDLVRAVETAQVIGERTGLAPELDARLREQHLGELEGRGYDETWRLAEQHDWSDPELPVAGGESPAQVRRRLVAVLDERDSGVPTVLVSHGDAIRSLLGHLTGHSPIEAPWVEVPNGSVVRFDGELRWLVGPATARATR